MYWVLVYGSEGRVVLDVSRVVGPVELRGRGGTPEGSSVTVIARVSPLWWDFRSVTTSPYSDPFRTVGERT